MSSKRKRAGGVKNYNDSEGNFDSVEDAPASKQVKTSKGKQPVHLEMQKDSDGNSYWELSRMRRIQITEWKGSCMVNIREYYEDKSDGKMKPGKKGIALSTDQFATFIELLPAIEKELSDQGVSLPRPKYDDEEGAVDDAGGGGAGGGGVQEETQAEADSGVNAKQNFEATSDEEDEE